MVHQFCDSGVKAIVILENFCDKLEEVLDRTDIESIFVTKIGDFQSPFQSRLMNFGIKYIKKLVPVYSLPNSHSLTDLSNFDSNYLRPKHRASGDDVCVILYTGGTTGVSKGAMLSHSNLITNMMQLRSRCLAVIEDKVENIAAPLPLYHSYAFLLHCLAMPYAGNHNILITNPRDLDGLIKLFSRVTINGFVGINTLYLAMLRHKNFPKVNFETLKFCGAGGMAMASSVMEEWEKVTGCEIYEGYGLTECSPVVSEHSR